MMKAKMEFKNMPCVDIHLCDAFTYLCPAVKRVKSGGEHAYSHGILRYFNMISGTDFGKNIIAHFNYYPISIKEINGIVQYEYIGAYKRKPTIYLKLVNMDYNKPSMALIFDSSIKQIIILDDHNFKLWLMENSVSSNNFKYIEGKANPRYLDKEIVYGNQLDYPRRKRIRKRLI